MNADVNSPSHHTSVLESEEARTNFEQYISVVLDVAGEVVSCSGTKVDTRCSGDTIKERSTNNFEKN